MEGSSIVRTDGAHGASWVLGFEWKAKDFIAYVIAPRPGAFLKVEVSPRRFLSQEEEALNPHVDEPRRVKTKV